MRFTPENPEGQQDEQADEIAAERDPDPQHAGPAEATDDPADTVPARDTEPYPGELPPELPDPEPDQG